MHTLLIIIVILLLLVGLVGTIIPFIPDIPLIFLGIAIYGWYDKFHVIDSRYLITLACLTLLSMVMNYLTTILGAKIFGSGKAGTWGSILGTIAGLIFLPPLGIIIGPFLGAVIGEVLVHHDFHRAVKVGVGSVAGLFSGMLFNFILALGIIISFIIKLT